MRIRFTKTTLKNTSILATLSIFMLGTIYFARMVSSPGGQDLRSRAATEEMQVQLFLYPKNISAQAGQPITIAPKLVAPDEKKISSVNLTFRFDTQFMKLKQVKEEDNGKLLLLKSTDIVQSNTKGEYEFFLGADDEENAPSGAVNLPRLEFEVLKPGTSSVAADSVNGEIIFTSAEKADLVIQSSSTIIASAATTLPSAIPTQILPSATILPSPIPSLSPSAATSASPMPTISLASPS